MKHSPSLVIFLATTVVAQFGPPAPPPNAGCALIIPGPGRSSAFDHANGVFGDPNYPGYTENTCITYEAVNAAFASARDRVGLPATKEHFVTEDVSNLGTVVQEATRYVAKQYGLSKDAIANGLPLIDTTKTAIEGYCPDFLMTPKCEVERYRSVSGVCNNIEHPHWGAAMNAHHRFMAPDYADGISAPRYSRYILISYEGQWRLPNIVVPLRNRNCPITDPIVEMGVAPRTSSANGRI